MKKLILLSFFIFLLNTSFSWAVLFYGESTEEDYRALGVNFPSVGYFARDDENPFGSGVLIDTNIEYLNGRVVLTAAHVFKNQSDAVSFHIGDQERGGHAIIHPAYHAFSEENKPYDIPYFPYDIALYFLDKPIHGISLAVLNLDLGLGELLRKKWFANCGFGISGQLNASSEETDTNRRACYNYASRKLNAEGIQDKIVSYRHEQGDVAVREIDVRYPAGSVLTLTPDCFLEPYGSIASGDSGGGVFLAEGGQLVGIIVGTIQTEIKGYPQTNPLHSSHIQLEDEGPDAAYKGRSVLVGFHREWLKESFAILAEKNIGSSLDFPETGQHTAGIETIVDLGVNISINGHNYESTTTTFPNSKDTVMRALQAKSYWFFVNNRGVSKEVRFYAAMELFESANEAIHATGCAALFTLSKDSLMSKNLREQAANILFKSDSPSICKMGVKAYKYIAEDTTADVCSRIDAALKLIFELNDTSYRNFGVDIYLDLAEKDYRVISEKERFAHALFILLRIKDQVMQDYLFNKCKSLLKNEHIDDQKKKTIKGLFYHLYGFDISRIWQVM